MRSVIRLEGIVREYQIAGSHSGKTVGQRVLNGVSCTIRRGDFVAVTGPSGSGKSTFLNLCALLDRADAGELFLNERPTVGLSDVELARLRGKELGFVFQSYKLLPYRSVLDNVLFRFRYVGTEDADGGRSRAMLVLREMGLAELAEKSARLLSGGEMQRVAIARAVVCTPSVLLADEPTGNLDAESSRMVMRCFQRLNQRGVTVLLATHDLSMLSYCNRHLVCRGGALEESMKEPVHECDLEVVSKECA